MHQRPNVDEALIARVAKAILVELGHVELPPSVAELDPEAFISDPKAKRLLYGDCSRGKFWALMKDPGAPTAYRMGRSNLRKVRDHLAFIAARKVV